MTLRQTVCRCLAGAVALACAAETSHALKRLGPGDAVPDVRVYTATHAPVSLSQLLGERGALVVFWASWSPRSPQALAHFAELHRSYGPRGLRVVPLNVEREGLAPAEAERLAADYGSWSLPWPTHFDPGLEAFDAVGVITLPTSVYLDRDLRIVGSYPGFPGEALEALPELIEKGLGIWAPPVRVRRPVEVGHQPKGGAGPLFHSGRVLFARGLGDRALASLDRAAEADPDFALAFAAGAFVAHRRGRLEEASLRLAALRARSGTNAAFREALGVALLGLGQDAEAQGELEGLLGEEEPHPRGLVGLALLHAGGGDLAAAGEVLARLSAWPLGGVELEIDLVPYLGTRTSPAELAAARDEVLLRLLGLSPPGQP